MPPKLSTSIDWLAAPRWNFSCTRAFSTGVIESEISA